MLRNYDDCNKIVTNGKSGAKNNIVTFGGQIVHASTEEGRRALFARALLRAWAIYARDKLEAGS